MNSFQRWLLISLVLWGIPAFFFWVGIGLWTEYREQFLAEACRSEVSARLDRVMEEVRFDRVFESWMVRDFAAVASLSPLTVEGRRKMARIAGKYPPGAIRLFFFDGEGGLCFPAGESRRPAIEAFFQEACIPWTESSAISPDRYRGMEELAERHDIFSSLFKVHEHGRTFALISYDESSNELATRGFLNWRKGRPKTEVAGMLAFLYPKRFPAQILMRKAIAGIPDGRGGIGFELESGVTGTPPGISEDSFREILKAYAQGTTSRFRFGEWLVEVRPCGFGRRFIAVAKPGKPSRGILWLVFTLYGMASLLFLTALYRSIHLGTPLRLSLPLKLLLLFLLGVVFPLAISGGLVAALLDLKREEIRLDLRRESLEALGGIEEDYQEFLAARERQYQDLEIFPGGAKPTIEGVMSRLPYINAPLMELFLLLSDNGTVLRAFRPVFNNDPQILSALQQPARLATLRTWIRNGVSLSYGEILRLSGNEDFRGQSRVTAQTANEEPMLQAMAAFSRNCMAQEKAKKYLNGPVRASERIQLDAFAGAEYQILFDVMRTALGKLSPYIGTKYSSFYFLGTVNDPGGVPLYSVALSHTTIALEHTFLGEWFSEKQGKMLRERVRAIMYPNIALLSFPQDRDHSPFVPLIRRMQLENAMMIDAVMTVEGREMQVVLRRSDILRRYILAGLTPASQLDRRLDAFRRRSWSFLAAAGLFCLGLGFMLYRRFLVPIGDVAQGIRALREKRFEYRVPFRGRDELGQLGMELNRTIEHLKDMELASAVQASLYPTKGVRAGPFFVRGGNIMTKAIGGDYYDFIPLPDGRLVVALGDVAGHGFRAALVAAMAKAGIGLLAPRYAPAGPDQILLPLGRQLLSILGKKMMMTCCLAILDPQDGTLSIANAGQCYPVLLTRSGLPKILDLSSHPLGVIKTARLACDRFELGDRALVLYSDCLVESAGRDGDAFGYDRFHDLLDEIYQRHGTLDLDAVFAGLHAFTGPGAWNDDATIVVIET